MPDAVFWAYPWSAKWTWEDRIVGSGSHFGVMNPTVLEPKYSVIQAKSLDPSEQEKVIKEYQFIFSCVLSGERGTFFFLFLLSNQTSSQSTYQSWILLPMKWRTYFPFIVKLYGLVAKTACFRVNSIWVWFEANYLNSLRVHFLIFKMGVMMVPGVMMLSWGLYDKMHVKHSEQDLECTHHTESINFFSVSKYCQRGLCDKETHHGEVIRTLLAPEPSSLKNKGRRCFSRGCRIQKGRSRTGYLICRAWYKMKIQSFLFKK